MRPYVLSDWLNSRRVNANRARLGRPTLKRESPDRRLCIGDLVFARREEEPVLASAIEGVGRTVKLTAACYVSGAFRPSDNSLFRWEGFGMATIQACWSNHRVIFLTVSP